MTDRDPPALWIAEAVERASRKDFARWEQMVHASGCCAQPVRLSGRVWTVDPATGDTTVAYSTAGEADRVLLKACGTRRATRCPACASTYRADAKMLLRAGLALPDLDDTEGTGDQPVVFVTLTAPSFGPVHRAHLPPGPCRTDQRRDACRHGIPLACGEVHHSGDGRAGAAVCGDCYDWVGAVLFNARVGELWRRTIMAVARHLAGGAGIKVRQFKAFHRLEFAKVVEFQARGIVHIHALARLDRHGDTDLGIDGATLAEAFASAAAQITAPNPYRPAEPVRWGAQIDVDVIPARRRRAAAAYLAKYATKSVDNDGLLDRRLRSANLDHLPLLPAQLAKMATTAWELGGQTELRSLNLRAWAHSLGYRGHWLTKSRGWSTTFGELRAARHRWRLAQVGVTPDEIANRWGEWDLQGVGHTNAGDAWLAASANTARRRNRRAAWEDS